MNNNFSQVQNSFAALVAAAQKFEGFKTPRGVEENVELAASALGFGNYRLASYKLGLAEAELARTLRGFINGSPAFFSKKLGTIAGLDEGLRAKLETAISRYAADVQKLGWEGAAVAYATMAGLLKQAPAMSERAKAAKAAKVRQSFAAIEESEAAARRAADVEKERQVQAQNAAAARQLRGLLRRAA